MQSIATTPAGDPHEYFERAQAASDSPRTSRAELALGSGDTLARPYVGRFRAPHRFRPAAALSSCPRAAGARVLAVRRSKSTDIWPCEGIARSQRQFGSRCSGRIRCGLSAFETFMGDHRLAWLQSIA